jgi:hypothetical protein
MPTEGEISAMMKYNEELVKAGVMLAGEGLHPSSKGARITFDGGTKLTDGPFTEAKELIAGFWIIQAKSKEEAVEWATRCPIGVGEIELRQVFAPEDFGEAFTPELQEKEERLRAESEKYTK